MKTVWIALGALGFISGAAFLVFWLLAWTRQVPPGEPLAISLGLMLLVVGLFSLGDAASKTADRGNWRRSNVKVGRLSAIGFGVVFCSIGIVSLGYGWLPEQFVIWLVAAVMAGFVVVLLGQTLDGRRARAQDSRGKPNDQRDEHTNGIQSQH